MRLKINVRGGASYEVEARPEELRELSAGEFKEIHEAVQRLLAGLEVAASEGLGAASLEGWVEFSGDRPHLGSPARELRLKDQVLLAFYALSLIGKKPAKLSEVYEFLRNDGFPVSYGSMAARANELAKEGLLMRESGGAYSLSRWGEERLLRIARGEGHHGTV